MKTISRDLRTLFGEGVLGTLTDGQLLDRFLARREEAVFEEIVRRHGPMVWGTCRRILRRSHDAEDAFQATFLVLARKGASVLPRERLASWLYGVAYQTALKARASIAKRETRERLVTVLPEPITDRPAVADELELRLWLDLELNRLPEKYRVPMVLCDLEGVSQQEAARRLGWPIGTVSGRLSRARTLLVERLNRHGRLASLAVGTLSLGLAREASAAGWPASLARSTAKAVADHVMGMGGVDPISSHASALAERVLTTMTLAGLKRGFAGWLAVGVVGFGLVLQGVQAGPVGSSTQPEQSQGRREAEPRPRADPPAAPKSDLELLQGTWFGTLIEAGGRSLAAKDASLNAKGAAIPPQVKLIVTGDRFLIRGPRLARTIEFGTVEDTELTLALAVVGEQKIIDLVRQPASKDKPALSYRGIYSLTPRRFKLCLDLPGQARPRELKTQPQSTQLLFDFKSAVIEDRNRGNVRELEPRR